MKRFKSFLVALAFIFAGVLAFSLASNTKVHAEGTTVTYTVASTSSVSVSGTAPTGSSAKYGSTYNTKCQLTSGNSMTLTLSGFEGNKITAISLSMKSNKSSGAGSLSVTAGTTTIASKESAAFNTETWHGAWSTEYVDVIVSVSNDDYTIRENEDVKIVIAATANSLFCQSFTITYEEGTIVNLSNIALNKDNLEMSVGDVETLTATLTPNNATYCSYAWASDDESVATVDETGKVTAVGTGTTTISAVSNHNDSIKGVCEITVVTPAHPEFNQFKELDLQEQLAFNYHYDNQYEVVSTPEEGKTYYLGSVDDGLYVGSKLTSSTLELSRGLSNAASYSVVLDGDYYLITVAGKYLIINGTSLSSASVDGATITDYYRWSFDSNSNRLINVGIKTRYLGINAAQTGVKAYDTKGSYTPVALISTSGEVTFKDAANNEDKVTMRIGYTISKELYDSLEALGTIVNFGVRLNDTTNVECTKVELDENNYRLFVAVNNIPLISIDTVLTACGYVSVDGTDYYTIDVNEYSVRTLAQKYLTDYATDDAVISAKYALIYLAYYA